MGGTVIPPVTFRHCEGAIKLPVKTTLRDIVVLFFLLQRLNSAEVLCTVMLRKESGDSCNMRALIDVKRDQG